MRSPVLGELLNTTADLAAAAEVPEDPFDRANLLNASQRAGTEILALASRIVERERQYRAATTLQERLDREPYAPPDGTPDPQPNDPPPDPPPPPPPPDQGGKR